MRSTMLLASMAAAVILLGGANAQPCSTQSTKGRRPTNGAKCTRTTTNTAAATQLTTAVPATADPDSDSGGGAIGGGIPGTGSDGDTSGASPPSPPATGGGMDDGFPTILQVRHASRRTCVCVCARACV